MQKTFKLLIAFASFGTLLALLYMYIAGVKMDRPTFQYGLNIELPHHRSKTQQLERLEERLQARTDVLMAECKRLGEDKPQFLQHNKPRLDHIIVNDKHKVLYCYVAKIANTNLKRVFLMLTGKVNVTDPLQIDRAAVHWKFKRHLTYLNKFSQTDVDYRLKYYKKAIFVREPMQRLLSAYRDKFLMGARESFRRDFGSNIIKMFRKNPSKKSLETGFDVTFPEFIEWITQANSYSSDEHWDSYYKLCSPCHIKYDFIGKYETLNEDVDLLLKQILVDNMIRFPRRNETYKTLKTEDTMNEFYAEINPEKIQKLHEIYSTDYSMFGYNLKDGLRQHLNSSV